MPRYKNSKGQTATQIAAWHWQGSLITMAIEDEELREIFQEASTEELKSLEEGLSRLQQNPEDTSYLEDLVRSAHSLKGNAGMLGLKDIATLTHQWEHLIVQIQQGKAECSTSLLDRLQQGLNALQKLIHEAVTGEPSGVQTFYVLALLMGGESAGPPSTEAGAEKNAEIEDSRETADIPTLPATNSRSEVDEASDGELLQIFQAASEDRLQKIDDGLSYLERHSEEVAKFEEILREIHGLKCDAKMFGFDRVERLSDEWEQQLRSIQQGDISLTSELFDRLYGSLDVIRQQVTEIVTGASPETTAPTLDTSSHEQPATPIPIHEPSAAAVSYIEDEELRETFHRSSEDHFQKLYDGLLRLEQHPEDRTPIDAILREIHSLKGDAGMLGVEVVASLAHDWEQQVVSVQARERDISSDLCDRLFRELDTLRQRVDESVTPTSKPAPQPIPQPTPPAPQSAAVESLAASSLYIDDDELRHTFQIASEDHLQKLDEGLLHLEQHPDDTAQLDRCLREIHSIKGDAGMLGVGVIAQVAHEWEQQLVSVKEGKMQLNADLDEGTQGDGDASQSGNEARSLLDRLYAGLDAIRALVNEAVTGRAGGLEVDVVLRRLQGKSERTPKAKPAAAPLTSTTQAPDDGSYRIDTIRVATRNLDALMTQAGELTVTKIRIAHRLSEIENIVNFWEEWSREAHTANRFLWEELQSNGSGFRKNAVQQLQAFHQQSEERLDRLGTLLNSLRDTVAEDTARLDNIADEIEDEVRRSRLLPLSTIFNLYPRLVRDLARSQNKNVKLVMLGGETRADKRILEDMKDPLTHIIRNAIDHGIESPEERRQLGKPDTAIVTLRGYQNASHIAIEVSDDGRGLNLEKIKKTALTHGLCRPEELEAMTTAQIQSLIFMPGFSTRSFVTEVSGRGVGLDVVRANVERLKGSIQIESEPNRGCTIQLHLGTTLATAHVLLFVLNGRPYALPVECVQTACIVDRAEIFSIEGRDTILFDDQPVSIVKLVDLLELPSLDNSRSDEGQQSCIIVKMGEDRLGLIVDRLLDEQDTILKPQSKLLARVRNVSGATILGTGEVCIVLNPADLVKSVPEHRRQSSFTTDVSSNITAVRGESHLSENVSKQTILLVEDSITTRTQEKRILEAAGYEVIAAVDGLDGYNKLRSSHCDAVVSDIQMPNLDGLELTARIRSQPQYSELPIILVTSLATDEDRRQGAEAGANAYITKSSFNQALLVETLRRLI